MFILQTEVFEESLKPNKKMNDNSDILVPILSAPGVFHILQRLPLPRGGRGLSYIYNWPF